MAPVPKRTRKVKGKKRRNRRVWCACGCERSISPAQAARHMRGLGPIHVRVAQELLRQVELEAGLITSRRTSPLVHSEQVEVREEEIRTANKVAMRRPRENARDRVIAPEVDNSSDPMFLDGQSDFVGDLFLHEELPFGDGESTGLTTRFNRLLQRMQNLDESTSDVEDSDSESESGLDDVPSTGAVDIREVEEMFAREFYNEVAGTGLPIEDDISEDVERKAAQALEGKLILLLL